MELPFTEDLLENSSSNTLAAAGKFHPSSGRDLDAQREHCISPCGFWEPQHWNHLGCLLNMLILNVHLVLSMGGSQASVLVLLPR